MAGIFQFFTALLGKVVAFAKWILLLVKQLFLDLWAMWTDLFCWVFEGILGIATAALDAIDIPFNPQTYYSLVPPDVANMLGVIGITQAFTIIVGALVVRFILQTIPFVRWGS